MNPFRNEFPILKQKVNGKPLAYLDSGATTQKPQFVIDAITKFYEHDNANIHRGLHELSERSTRMVDATRVKFQKFINAESEKDIIFTYGTTSGINLVAHSFGSTLKKSDEVIISELEHHANIVPWQELKKRNGIKLTYIPITKNRTLNYTALQKLISKKTKLISVTHISNVLGCETDIPRIVRIAKKVGAKVLIDAAQSIAHTKIDVQKLGIDFLVCSGHKMYGPTGVGVLYMRHEYANTLPPFLTGGDMIINVDKQASVYQESPQKFEAGTINIAQIIGLGAAVDWITKNKLSALAKQEKSVARYAHDQLSRIPELTLHSPKGSVALSFTMQNIHPHDIAEIVNTEGVAIRSGNHCAMPLHRILGEVATARATFACYNTKKDVDQLIRGIKKAIKIFS